MEEVRKYPLYLAVVDDIVSQYQYGEIVLKDWLLERLELQEPEKGTFKEIQDYQFKVLAAMELLKEKLLEDHNILLRSTKGRGYTLVHPEQQTDVVWEMLSKKLKKEVARAAKGLFHIEMESLTAQAQAHNHDLQAKLASLRAHTAKALKP